MEGSFSERLQALAERLVSYGDGNPVDPGTLTEQADSMAAMMRIATEASALVDEIKAANKLAQNDLIYRMEREGVKSFRTGQHNYVSTYRVDAKVQDEQAFVDWAKVNAPELLEPKPRKGRLNELVRERINSGQVTPPGVDWFRTEYVSKGAA